jgi:hypothetical protein
VVVVAKWRKIFNFGKGYQGNEYTFQTGVA